LFFVEVGSMFFHQKKQLRQGRGIL
jgi:hypothetical protein